MVYLRLENPFWRRFSKDTFVPKFLSDHREIRNERKTYPPTQSKFGGTPFMEVGFDIPSCVDCQKEMPFLLQINSEDFQEENREFGDGILQVFYCDECYEYEAFTGKAFLRILPDDSIVSNEMNEYEAKFGEEIIIGWREEIDFPEKIDYSEVLLTEIYLEDSSIFSTDEQKFEELEKRSEMGNKLKTTNSRVLCNTIEKYRSKCRRFSKYLGIPKMEWDAIPKCPICMRECDFIFQIGTLSGLDFVWGDFGVALIFQCQEHENQIGLMWTSK